jgi:hypothetical protein
MLERRIFGPKRKKEAAGEHFIMWSFINCILHLFSLQ